MFDFYFEIPHWIRLIIQAAAVIFTLFPIAAACSMAERKVAAWVQDRPGPNRTIAPILAWIPGIGFLRKLGVFQLAADGGKFMFKEDVVPGHVNKAYFIAAPILAVIPALTTIAFIPFGAYLDAAGKVVPLILANVDVGLLAVFAISSLSVYSVILAGWASNSKYPFLGSVRASAQLISYELSMTLSVLPVFLWINGPLAGEAAGSFQGTLGLARVVEFQSGSWGGIMSPGWGGVWFGFLMPVSAFVYLVALFAETNRAPFDTVESEADLVNSFASEYGAFKWSLFYVAEYCHMIVGSAIFMLLFGGGWNPLPWFPLADLIHALSGILPCVATPLFAGLIGIGIFVGKVLAMIFFFMWVRWTLPRFRYDQVMKIGWQKLLPLSIANLIFYAVATALLTK